MFKPTQTIGIKGENATFVLEMRREKSVNNGLSGSWQHKQWSETQAVVRNDCTATIKQKHSLLQSYSQHC